MTLYDKETQLNRLIPIALHHANRRKETLNCSASSSGHMLSTQPPQLAKLFLIIRIVLVRLLKNRQTKLYIEKEETILKHIFPIDH